MPDYLFLAFRLLRMIFEHQMTSLATEAAVYERAVCILFLPLEASTSTCRVHLFHLHKVFKMPDCPQSGQSDTGMNKNADAGPVRYRNKGTPSGFGMLRCRNEMLDAGMPMPAASASTAI